MKIKKKILILLLLIITLFNTIFINLSFCAYNDSYYTTDFNFNSEGITFLCNDTYYTSNLINSSSYKDILVFYYSSEKFFRIFGFNDNSSYDFYNGKTINLKNVYFLEFYCNSVSFIDKGFSEGIVINCYQEDLYYNSFDIYDIDDNLVFQRPAQEMTLAQVLEKNNPVKTFQIMTRGIIPYLILFLVGLVAFWKAWQLLSKELRKA